MKSLIVKYNYHFLALLILSSYYSISLIFFGNVIIDPQETLTLQVPFNHIVSQIYNGNPESLKIFLSGEFRWFYLDRILYPINLFTIILGDKTFFFFEEILKKFLAYYSFFVLGKYLTKNNFYSSIAAILYTTIVTMMIDPAGYGMPMIPYLLYILISKNNLTLKYCLIILITGLNSNLVFDYFSFFLIIPFAFLIERRKFKIKNYLIYLSIITPSIILANLQLFYAIFEGMATHRDEIEALRIGYLASLKVAILKFFSVSITSSSIQIFLIPQYIFYFAILIASVFSNNKKILIILFSIIAVLLIRSLVGSQFIDFIFQGFLIPFKGIQYTRVDRVIPLMFSLLVLYNLLFIFSPNKKKFLYLFLIISILFIQSSVPLREVGKSYFLHKLDRDKFSELHGHIRNKDISNSFKLSVYAIKNRANSKELNFESNKNFDDFYEKNNYLKIKSIVKDKRVISIGIEPGKAAFNDIRVVDGYYLMYPLSYKKKFRKIISEELEINIDQKNYFDKWGNKLYAFYNDKNNLLINFKEAKKIGADYVISSFKIQSKDLEIVCNECNGSKKLFVYKIL